MTCLITLEFFGVSSTTKDLTLRIGQTMPQDLPCHSQAACFGLIELENQEAAF